MDVKSFRDLEVWQSGIQVAKRAYKVSRVLPQEERFALADQIRRSAVSVPANIAEGWAREYTKEYLRHLSVARGSLAELDTLILLCIELEYVAVDRLEELLEETDRLGRKINALQTALRRKLDRE